MHKGLNRVASVQCIQIKEILQVYWSFLPGTDKTKKWKLSYHTSSEQNKNSCK